MTFFFKFDIKLNLELKMHREIGGLLHNTSERDGVHKLSRKFSNSGKT